MKVTPSLLYEVAQDNRTLNQIGDNIEDGLGWDVGNDMGLTKPEEAARLPISPEAAKGVGSIATGHNLEVSQVSTDAESAPSRKLTIAKMKANAARHLEDHLKRTNKQVIDPHYG